MEEKEFMEERDEFNRFDIRNLIGMLKKFNDEKTQIKVADIGYNVRFLGVMRILRMLRLL